MYARHVPIISEYMRASPEGFARGVLFVILSIRQKIRNVPAQLEAVTTGEDTSYLFGHKREAYAYVSENAVALLHAVTTAQDECEALDALTRVPGLGVVKAAFVLQLMGFDVACLDSRNIKREGRNARAFRSDGEQRKTLPSFRRKIELYVGETKGKAEHYWDTWCADVATEYDMTADEVSALHLEIVPDDYIPF